MHKNQLPRRIAAKKEKKEQVKIGHDCLWGEFSHLKFHVSFHGGVSTFAGEIFPFGRLVNLKS
jgi:hypothetical protein